MPMWKIRLTFGLIACFLVSGYLSCDELNYATFGKKAQGTVTESYEQRESRGSGPVRIVRFRYTDAEGQSREGYDRVAPETAIAVGQAVPIQFVPGGEFATRLDGNRKLVPVAFFAVCLVGMLAFLAQLAREANEPTTRGRKR